MVFKLIGKEKGKSVEARRTFKTRKAAEKHRRFIRQIDNDLPRSRRNPTLKTFKVIKVIPLRKLKKKSKGRKK